MWIIGTTLDGLIPTRRVFSATARAPTRTVFGLNSVYTPQMVVDGTTEFVGNDSHLASQAVQKSLTAAEDSQFAFRGISLDDSKTLAGTRGTDALPETIRRFARPTFIWWSH